VRQKTAGLPLEWLDGEEARRLEPAITVETCAATISTTEKHVEARRLARSLALGGARRGVRIREHTPVTGFTTAGRRVTEVCTPGGRISCGTVVVAGGAWSGAIGEMLHAELPVFPIRGQILALSCMPPPVRHTIYTHDGYLVPKADGRLMVGSTEDEAGFDTRPSAGGILKLLSAAVRLVPALAGAPFDSAWAGLRPASADGLPILGPLPEWENAHVATGHFRNGILLAPITGEIVSHGILTGEPHALLSAFVAGRFTQKQAAR
jgi:glycine oxidase